MSLITAILQTHHHRRHERLKGAVENQTLAFKVPPHLAQGLARFALRHNLSQAEALRQVLAKGLVNASVDDAT